MSSPRRKGARESDVLAGKYRLDALLGAGGMGEVYRAVRIADGAPFAVKVLRSEHCSDPILVERFLREARAADLVRHPNVVRILDTGVDENETPYFVQELLNGEDLSLCLKSCGGRLKWDIAIDLLLPIVEAMGVAHASGVVHRDLKPGNVYLARIDGKTTPKLLDFGISSVAASTEISRITSTGISLGTPAYMSPEQVMGQTDVDARSDVWSLGVMLYELVAGTIPFSRGETPGALFVQICTSNPTPLESVVADVPRDLARIVARCLRRKHAERFDSAAELADALRRVRSGEAVEIASMPEQEAPPGSVAVATRAARLASASTDDVATVASPVRSAHFSTAGGGSMREIELDESASEAKLKLASIPPPVGFSMTGARPAVRAIPRDTPARPSGSAVAFIAPAAIVGVGASFVSPLGAGWSVLGTMESLPNAATLAVAAGSLVLGALSAVGGARRSPIGAALLAGAIGWVGLAIAIAVFALLPDMRELPPRVAPWAASLGAAGLAAHGGIVARRLWSDDAKAIAIGIVALSACAFAAAALFARAAFL